MFFREKMEVGFHLFLSNAALDRPFKTAELTGSPGSVESLGLLNLEVALISIEILPWGLWSAGWSETHPSYQGAKRSRRKFTLNLSIRCRQS